MKSKIENANVRIWLANAYFSPEFKLQICLEEAAKRGVDVRLMTSGNNSDVFFMPFISRLFYQKSLKAGIKLYEYLPAFFHGKVFFIDDYVTIGSSNFNHRSIFHDLEVDVIVGDLENKNIIKDDLEKCFLSSKRINEDFVQEIPYWQTLIARVLSVFKYWL